MSAAAWKQRGELESLIESIGPSRRLADAILAAGYVKPRTITTAEELDALPNGSVFRSESGFTFAKWTTSYAQIGHRETFQAGTAAGYLPATIIYTPKES